jgi:hypothetical protein
VLLQWIAGPISLNSECPQKASELNGFRQAIPYRGGCTGVGLATQRFNLVRYNEPHASHRRREPVPPDSLLRGGEIVPLHIANGKMIRSAIADMRIVCDAYLNGLTIPSR